MKAENIADSISPEISVVLPCLNEARTLEACINEAKAYTERSGRRVEIIVADNGSTDGSRQIALRLGARVVQVHKKGYGSALRQGIQASRGKYVVMGDSDMSYDLNNLEGFIAGLDAGNALVMGNRFKGGIEENAMPWLHQYFGNPMLTLAARLIFRVPVKDVYCGLRAFTREAFDTATPQSDGMEFALEMLIRMKLSHLPIAEIPTCLRVDGRDRKPHLRTWTDGLRSLRLYLKMFTEVRPVRVAASQPDAG